MNNNKNNKNKLPAINFLFRLWIQLVVDFCKFMKRFDSLKLLFFYILIFVVAFKYIYICVCVFTNRNKDRNIFK